MFLQQRGNTLTFLMPALFKALFETLFETLFKPFSNGFCIFGLGSSFSRFFSSEKHTETSIQQRGRRKQQRSCSNYYTSFVVGQSVEKAEQRPFSAEGASIEADCQPHAHADRH